MGEHACRRTSAMRESSKSSWKRTLGRYGLALAIACALIGTASAQNAQPSNGDLDIVEVQPDFYMIAGAGGNIGVQRGPAGIVLVDTGFAGMSDKILAGPRRTDR